MRLGRSGAGKLEVAQQNTWATAKNIALVEYTGAQTGAFGHDYFRTNKAVVADMVLTIAGDRHPGLEGGRPLTHLGGLFWQLDDSYAGQARTPCAARPGKTCGTAVSQ